MKADVEAARVETAPGAARQWGRLLLGVGPGLVFVLGSLGPRDLVSNAIAGSTAGTRLLWVLAAGLIVRLVVLDSSARYVMATGESLLAGCGRLGRWVVLLWSGVAILGRHLSALMRLMLLGTAAHILLPLPTRHSVTIWGIGSWTAGFVLLFWGRYRAVEKLSKPLAAAMGACLAATAILSKPDPSAIVSGLLHPALPVQRGVYSPALVVMSVVAASMGSFSNLRYAAYVHEKGWRSAKSLLNQRVDMCVGVLGMFTMLVLLQVAAASALLPRGIQVRHLDDLIPIFSQVLGEAGRILFGVTLWCVSFSGYVGNGAGYGLLFSEAFHRFVRPSKELVRGEKTAGHMPAYRWLVFYIFITPLYVFLTGWTPVGLVLAYAAFSVVTLPLIAVIVLRLTSDRKLMGALVNNWFANAVLVLSVLGSLYLSWEAAMDGLRALQGR